MTSKIDICNLALQEVGANYITSLNEDNKSAIECNLRYEPAKRALLEMHPWNFAIKRAKLNASVDTPEFNYGKQFPLPADFLYMVMTSLEESYQSKFPTSFNNSTLYNQDVVSYGTIDKYRIEGRNLVSHEDSVNIVYVADIDDTQQFSPTFTTLLARYLASKIAYRLTGSNSERGYHEAKFESELLDFQSIDSQQGVMDRIEVSTFLSERM